MSTYHKSTLGQFARRLIDDRDGYIATTAEEVMRLSWAGEMYDFSAEAIAEHNTAETLAAEKALAEWRANGGVL